MGDVLRITLNSFVRKAPNSGALKQLIKSTGATLTRKGRSRNWHLLADTQQLLLIIELIHQSGEENWFWVPKKISENKPHLSHEELLEFARLHANITVTQLMAATDCKLLEARKIIDELEWL
ncbi:MAG: hypothetical protein ACJAWS_003291 [Oleiphilaceae bacterium]|jgi:hypothetical protein